MFTDLLGISLTSLVESAGYIGLFGIVFAESGLPFGFIFPGDSLLFVAGLLASQGIFDISILLVLITTAAILGDSVGYATGSYFGPKLFSGSGFFFNEKTVGKTERFYARYGVSALILARFVPTVRTFVPIFAGVGHMPYKTFLTYNIVGGVLWGTGVTLIGYVLGHAFPQVEHYLVPIIAVTILVSSLPLIFELYTAWRLKKKGEQDP